MRILAATHGDGTNRTFQKLMSTLVRGGHDMRVIAWDRVGDSADEVSIGGIHHEFILHGGGFRNALLALWYPWWVLRLTIRLLRERPNLVWAANFESGLPAALSSFITHVPFVYYIHDNVCMTYRIPLVTELILRPLDALTVRRSAVVAVPDASRIEKHMRRHAAKIRVFPNSPSLGAEPLSGGPSGAPDAHVYVNGSLWSHRGILVLLEAARQVPACQILIAGRVTEQCVADAIEGNPQVDYVGVVEHEEAMRLYRRCRTVFAFYDPGVPINVCASPTKLYEAMLMGRPVIINSEVDLSSRVLHWGVGYTCAYHDVHALAAILQEVVADGEPAARMGHRAREQFERELSWERVGEGLLEAVADAAGSLHTQEVS